MRECRNAATPMSWACQFFNVTVSDHLCSMEASVCAEQFDASGVAVLITVAHW